MSFINAGLLVQSFLSRYGNRDRTYETIRFVMDLSRANRKVNIDPNTFLKGPGKLRQVRINYFPILCDTEGSCDTTICDTGVKVEPRQEMFAITRCIASKIYSIEKDDIRLTDNGAWDFNETAMEIITGALPDLRRQTAIEWETLLYSMAGVHTNGAVTKQIQPVQNANGIVNPIGILQLRKEYMDGGFSRPYVLGGDDIFYLKEMVGMGGLNAQGQLINKVDTNDTYYDDGLGQQILDDDANGGWIFSAAPETFKYVWYSENAGIFRTDLANASDLDKLFSRGIDGFIYGIFIDPATGMMWDLYINFDKCDQTWSMQLKHRYNFFVMPDVACNVQGVNGLMKWRTCPQVLLPCPEGTTPSTPVAVTFSWTPGSLSAISPIYQSLIGGYGVTQSTAVTITTLAQLATYMTENSNGTTFVVNGSDIEYDGFVAVTGNFNNGDVTFTFAP